MSEDKNFNGVSESLQKNLQAAIEKYTAANQAFLGLMNRIVAGENVPVADFETAGWNARAESFRLWDTSVNELDTLLATRVSAFRHSRLVSFSGIGATFALVVAVVWFIDIHLPLANYGAAVALLAIASVSFIGVGLLLLLIGYLAPVPPHKEDSP